MSSSIKVFLFNFFYLRLYMRNKKKAGRKKLPKSQKKQPFSMKLPPSLLRRLVLNSKKCGMKAVRFAEIAIDNECKNVEYHNITTDCSA